jgi:dTMP kinase
MQDGTLIALEGIDGSGKSSVRETIQTWADNNDESVITTAEPTNTAIGDVLLECITHSDTSALTELFLFYADRANHINYIETALTEGYVVVVDRYVDSTRAYQTHRIADEMGIGYDEARDWMNAVFDQFVVEPDITIYIDVSVETALERTDGEANENREQLEAAKDAYDKMYDSCDAGVRIINGEQPKHIVKDMAINVVKAQLRTDNEFTGQKTYAERVRNE